MAKSAIGIIISRVLGFLGFLVLLGIANLVMPHVQSAIYSEIVLFFNSMIYLLLIMMAIGTVNEIFWNWPFPFSILAPVTGAIFSFYVIQFLYALWLLIDSHLNSGINVPIDLIRVWIPVIVVVVGYIVIATRTARPRTELKITMESEDKERRMREEKEMWEKKAARLQEKMEKLEARLKRKHGKEAKAVTGDVHRGLRRVGDAISGAFGRVTTRIKERRKRRKQNKK